MQNQMAKMNLLLFSLTKKLEKLELLREYTLKQAQEGSGQGFLSLYQKKQILIEEIERLDQGFEVVLEGLLPLLKEDPSPFQEIVKDMQQWIDRINQLVAEIQALEKENYVKYKINKKQSEPAKTGCLPPKIASSQYQKMKKDGK